MRRFLLVVLIVTACRAESILPKLFPVPAASLVDENERTVNLDSMKGSVTVYDFIFTRCTGVCPVMSMNMRKLTEEIPDDAPVRFVSISVDPAHDTPEALRAYAKRFRDDDRWMFLTGERQAILDVSVKGFKLAAGDPVPGGEALLHSSKFALADKSGVIRAYFDGADGESRQKIVAAIRTLVAE